jgi:lipoprotein-releasing system permease protein
MGRQDGIPLGSRSATCGQKASVVPVGTIFVVLGVAQGGRAGDGDERHGRLRAEFREKVLGVNAHVLILKY